MQGLSGNWQSYRHAGWLWKIQTSIKNSFTKGEGKNEN